VTVIKVKDSERVVSVGRIEETDDDVGAGGDEETAAPAAPET